MRRTNRFRTVIAGLAGIVLGACTSSYGEQSVLEALAPIFIPQALDARANELRKQGKFENADAVQKFSKDYQEQLRLKAMQDAIRASGSQTTIIVPPQVYSPQPAYPQQPQAQITERRLVETREIVNTPEIMVGLYNEEAKPSKYYDSIRLLADFNGNDTIDSQEIIDSTRKNVFSTRDKFYISAVLKNPTSEKVTLFITFSPVIIHQDGTMPCKPGIGNGKTLEPGQREECFMRCHPKALINPGDYRMVLFKVQTPSSQGSEAATIRYFSVR